MPIYYGRRNYYGRPRWNGWRRYNATQGRVMARRASRPAPTVLDVEEYEPATKRVWDATPAAPRYVAPSRSTRSGLVKLTYSFNPALMYAGGDDVVRAAALRFTLNDVPGFSDYVSVYSEYRIVKGELVFSTAATTTNTGTLANYLVVSSQPFAQTAVPETSTGNLDYWVPPQTETTLRQTRWQRVIYPESVTTGVRVGFRPYTMAATEGPSGSSGTKYQRIWHGGAWTPFTWATATTPINYFGPYIWKQTTESDVDQAWSPYVTLTLWLYFKGQK